MSLTLSPLLSRIVSPSITLLTWKVCELEQETDRNTTKRVRSKIFNGLILGSSITPYITELSMGKG